MSTAATKPTPQMGLFQQPARHVPPLRVGLGWDCHAFSSEKDRPLRLGGVTLRPDRGLLGHSDGDVLCHAVADAILGATGKGDLGASFPPGRDETRDISGLEILRTVAQLIGDALVVSLDAVLLCQEPRLQAHIPTMRENIATALALELARVSVKAKSPEGLGALGRSEGIAAQAVALVMQYA